MEPFRRRRNRADANSVEGVVALCGAGSVSLIG